MQDEAGASLIDAADHTDGSVPASTPDEGAPPTVATGVPSRRRLFLVLWLSALVVYVLDQVTKIWALQALDEAGRIDVFGSAIGLQLIRNPGAAFSIGDGSTWVLTIIAVAVLVFIVVTSRRLGSRAWAWALGLLLGGSVGNLTDRMVREPGPGRGHVIDFIDYFGWFIGNVADIAIVSAAVLIGILAVRGVGVDGTRPTSGGGRHEARPAGDERRDAPLNASDDTDV